MSNDVWPTALVIGSLPDEDLVRRCEELLDDPVLAAVMIQLDEEAISAFRQSSNPQQREDMWHRVAVIADIRRSLNSVIENLKMRTLRERRKTVRTD